MYICMYSYIYILFYLSRESKIKTYQKMWSYMENKMPSVFVKNYDEGVKRVKKVGPHKKNVITNINEDRS